MANTRTVEPVTRFCAVITAGETQRQWALRLLAAHWGEVIQTSQPVAFHAGGYYRDEMGANLLKTLVAFAPPSDPAGLADWKLQTNRWEWDAAARWADGPPRPLNLDPGYITQAKFVLATVKDRDHRLYLRDGIFAEITLSYRGGRWVDHRWTYPDYRTPQVAAFATACRLRLRAHLRATGGFRTGRKNSFLADDRDDP